ncbi:MAG TPA: D-arabinono-1,4-lactone oxidase [Chitinophagaceae bacterium]|nr:D-arabinono-1,4-lactone oxidase [Chitinophagaceae bacterium]
MKKRTFLKLSSMAVAGAALKPMAAWAQNETITNWSGNLTYGTHKLTNAMSAGEVKNFVQQHKKFKVLGTRHCFNNIADSRDEFLSLTQAEPAYVIDAAAKTVTVNGGTRYGTLAEYLNNHGWALHNLASLPHISVAGSCATATHGSGVHNGNLSSAVAGMEIITAKGEVKHLSKEKDGEAFLAAVVSLGALGVVTRVTLNIQPTYMVRQNVFEDLSFNELEHNFDAIMGAGYSVSLFTDWQNKNVGEVWVKSRVTPGENYTPQAEFYGAKAATRNVHPIIALDAINCTDQMGVPGPWHERLPHFKMGFTPSSGKELQAEYFVPREHSYKAMMAVEKLHEEITPHLFITEIRTIDADDLWMSPCYKQPSTTIHFTLKPEWDAVQKLLPKIEAALAPFNGTPHWGKLFTMPYTRLAQVHPKMKAFQQVVKEYDPTGVFTNDFLKRNIWGA